MQNIEINQKTLINSNNSYPLGFENNSTNIFVCYHKPSFVIDNPILTPIHVGKNNSTIDLGFIGDNMGLNISNKNKYFCELTATYWIWKNVSSKIVGLFHYRRFLNLNNNVNSFHYVNSNFSKKYGLSEDNIQKILQNYDIILPKQYNIKKLSIYDTYKKWHISSDLDLVLNIIKEKYPYMYNNAVNIINSHNMYTANMLICKKELFDEYANWLFDILFEVENRIHNDVLKRDDYQQRVYGFLAERMMKIFIASHPDLRVKEVPILFYEENRSRYIKNLFKNFRRRIKNKVLSILLGKK